jgi:hypothetical protein
LLDSLESGGTDQGYTSPNNGITDPKPSAGFMEDEYSGNNDTQAAYREFMCGKGLTTLTAYNWRLISVPCDTGSNDIDTLFGGTSGLGTYGTNWVMYEQSGTDGYETNDTHPNTDKRMLQATDILELGKSYWIITDANHTVTIDRNLTGLAPTVTTDASGLGVSSDAVKEVNVTALPDNAMRYGGEVKKYMAGNPFPYAFLVKNLYFKHGSGSYNPMGDSANDTYIDPTFYKHDSSDTSDKNTSAGGGYEAVNPATPGFDKGGIKAMEGFFIKIEKVDNDTGANSFAYPLRMINGSGE